MTIKDIKILNNLLERTENLPEILHLRAAEPEYKLTGQDKELLLDTYSKLDDILKEVAAFINIRFPGCERHVRAWNEIDFDTKIGGFKIITTDLEHIKREWRKGLFDLKSLIKILTNEAVLLVDEQDLPAANLSDISSEYEIEHYTDEKVIPNQNLVKDTISFFETGMGRDMFSPIGFLNLLDKQYDFVKLNYNNAELVVNHLKSLALSDRQKHTLYGFILKWFGGYPVNNLDEDFNKTLKAIEKEFLGFNGDTPEKQYCKADQAVRNKFEKYGIAFTTAINHGIDVNEILAAMGMDEPEEKHFQNFSDLFAGAVEENLLGPYVSTKDFLIAQSSYNYEFNVWLQTHKNWEYRNEEQYAELLTIAMFREFLIYKTKGIIGGQETASHQVSLTEKELDPLIQLDPIPKETVSKTSSPGKSRTDQPSLPVDLDIDFEHEMLFYQSHWKKLFVENEEFLTDLKQEFAGLPAKPKLRWYFNESINDKEWNEDRSKSLPMTTRTSNRVIAASFVTQSALELKARKLINQFDAMVVEQTVDPKYFGRFLQDTEIIQNLKKLDSQLKNFKDYVFSEVSIDTFAEFGKSAAKSMIRLISQFKSPSLRLALLSDITGIDITTDIAVIAGFSGKSEQQTASLLKRFGILNIYAQEVINSAIEELTTTKQENLNTRLAKQDFTTVFKNPDKALHYIDVLKKVTPPIIGEQNQYILGDRKKGAIVCWFDILSLKGIAHSNIPPMQKARLLNEMFPGLSITGRSTGNISETAEREYRADLERLITKI